MHFRLVSVLGLFFLFGCGKSSDPAEDAPSETAEETGDASTDSGIEESVYSNTVSCMGRAAGEGTSEYVKNKGLLCVVTSEVNWKIGKGLLDNVTKAEKLRDCMATCLEKVDNNQGGKCQDSALGFTNNDTCWAALTACELKCGGPDVKSSSSEAEPN